MLHTPFDAILSAFHFVADRVFSLAASRSLPLFFPLMVAAARVFERYEKKLSRTHALGAIIVPIKGYAGGQIALNVALSRIRELSNVRAVEILWSKDAAAVALKPAQRGDPNTYALHRQQKTGIAVVSTRSFLRAINWVAPDRLTVPARWNSAEGQIEIDLPRKFLKDRDGAA